LLRTRACAWALVLALALCLPSAPAAQPGPTGKLQGKIAATDTGEPIGFADVQLLPADTTLRPVGMLTNADGTFLLEAAPGRYTLRVRAMSYARKEIEGVVLEAGKLLPFSTALTPDAILQEEIVVAAEARRNTETAMLAARKKAAAVGDAVSAEVVRKSPDKNAAEVLRRVTGLSVSSGKFVFVRGLGERYSSTEVDGVRIASPEQNKRVVPLDLFPSALLDHIVVQKTYTADRPGEFGGGDVQVHTKDFPGTRTWSFSVSQAAAEGVTLRQLSTYPGSSADLFGFGADARKIPDEVYDVAGDRPLKWSSNPDLGFDKATLAGVARSFSNVWSPTSARTIPNASYSATYGDEFRLFGRPLGLVGSGSMSRGFSSRDEAQRFFQGTHDTLYDYAVSRSQESVRLGALSGLSYRLSPRHTLHLRGLYTNSADDEVRTYQGPDHNWLEGTTGTWLVHRSTRLMYVQRSVLSGALEGRHELAPLFGTSVNWKFSRSRAKRLQPDRREVIYDRGYYHDAGGDLVEYWALSSRGMREYGDLRDNGWGTMLSASLPYALGGLGKGKVVLGFDRQSKERRNFYRRVYLYPSSGTDLTAPPESIFTSGSFDGSPGSGYAGEGTLDQDNYRATQMVTAGYLSIDVPLGRRLRGNFGVRVESGQQDVRSFDLFDPSRITATGDLDNTDWLPCANLTWGLTETMNLRLGASRTLSRPDLNELSPSPALEYVGGMQVSGNPDLERALIDNYDVRLEAFPTLSEVLAAGFFYKRLHEPIEQVIQGGSPLLLIPRNSDRGRNLGVELEVRSGLDRFWSRLNGLSFNANASFISSEVRLKPQVSKLGSEQHPLQGQANYLVNLGLGYASARGQAEAMILLSAVGKRLHTLGVHPLPDIYEQPILTLDATLNWSPNWPPLRGVRMKFAGRNLLDPRIRQLQGGKEVSGFNLGRSYSVALSYGS
jgi:hypothetical protein